MQNIILCIHFVVVSLQVSLCSFVIYLDGTVYAVKLSEYKDVVRHSNVGI